MRFFLALFLTVIVVFLGIQGYRLFKQQKEFAERAATLEQEQSGLASENAKLNQDIQFYQNSENATKELQSKANYRKPDEKMIILVPAEP